MPVPLPDKVEVSIDGGTVGVKGPKGALSFRFPDAVRFGKKDGAVTVEPVGGSPAVRALWGTARTLVANMVAGVTAGFSKRLEFNGVGYKAQVKGRTLVLSLGHSHPIDYKLPEGVGAKVEKGVIEISGCDKELVGQCAAKVRSFRPPEPYKGKGVKYVDERIIRKAGKASAKK